MVVCLSRVAVGAAIQSIEFERLLAGCQSRRCLAETAGSVKVLDVPVSKALAGHYAMPRTSIIE
jgi:hypothetical protein